MQLSDLDFKFPERLIATKKRRPSRVMWKEGKSLPREISLEQLIESIQPNDVLVINETKVIKCRLFTDEGMEILFLNPLTSTAEYQVLCPARDWPQEAGKKKSLNLPEGVKVNLIDKGLPQKVQTSKVLGLDYFQRYGNMPLPPYIQKARGERASSVQDDESYQTVWAKTMGSLAAPTASLHFSESDILKIKNRGVSVLPLCLHVGLGTFLPIKVENILEHKMHAESVSIPKSTLNKIAEAKKKGGKVWALGTTVARSLESIDTHFLVDQGDHWEGETSLFITPGFDFKIVDVLMTNFHQPKSTLLSLVAAFAGLDRVKSSYEWAMEKEFQLFSYGDLTVWIK